MLADQIIKEIDIQTSDDDRDETQSPIIVNLNDNTLDESECSESTMEYF